MNRLMDSSLRWLPAHTRRGVLQRVSIVWVVALIIAVAQWLVRPEDHSLLVSMIYSYAISTFVWFLCDPMRIVLHPWLRTQPPYYWSTTWRTVVYLMASILLGYSLGTALGDAVVGRSTWELMALSPHRFWRFALASAAISLGFLFYFRQRERAHELQRQATEARLKLLEAQLEPHMLFNTLANLRVLIASDPSRAIDMLDRLNAFLRATLRGSRADSASGTQTLADEFARLDDYLALMAVRMGPRLNIELDLPSALGQHPVPPLLLQPVVENAIRHGLEPKVGPGQIQVRARADGGRLILEVADTGVGLPEAVPAGDTVASTGGTGGFGLAQVRERVAVASDGRGSVQVMPGPAGGTTVRIELPLSLSA